MYLIGQRRNWLPGIIFVSFLLLYGITTLRGVSTADNAEFQWVGATHGLAHPPGFPLYTLLANGVSRLPIGDSPAFRINLFSALTSALTLVVVYLSVLKLTRYWLAGVVSVLALGTATTFWAQATVANVRSLTALFAAVAFWLLFTIFDLRITSRRPGNSQFIILFALTVGFGFTHHLSLAFIFLIMVIWLLWLDWRMWKWLPFGLIGLLPWLYLPWHSAELRTPSKLLEYALGLGFGGDFFAFSTAAELWLRAGVMLNVLTFQMNWILLLAALGGLIVCWRRFRPIAVLLGSTFLLHSLITATYRAPQTVEYMMPAYVPLAICIGVICGGVMPRLPWKQSGFAGRLTTYFIPVFLLIILVWHAGLRLPSFMHIASNRQTIDAPLRSLLRAPDNAVILANWHWYTAYKYHQDVDNVRSDLRVVYVVPDGESYAENWVAAISAEIDAGNTVIATNHYDIPYRSLPPAQPEGNAWLWPNAAQTEIPADFRQARLSLGNLIEIEALRFEDSTPLRVGEEGTVTLAWRAVDTFPQLTLFAHLVAADGRIYAQDDVPLRAQAEGYSLTQFRLTPRIGSPPGDYALLIGAYGADGVALKNEDANTRSNLLTLPVAPSYWRMPTANPELNFNFSNLTLRIGTDHDCTDMETPRLYQQFLTWKGVRVEVLDVKNNSYGVNCYQEFTRYVPLGTGIVWMQDEGRYKPDAQQILRVGRVRLTERFAAFRPIFQDIATSVSLTGLADDGQTWAWREQSDSIPATGAIPTLKWIAGSRIRDPHSLAIPDEAVNGQIVEGRLILYDAFTNRPIPVLDERIAQQGVGIPLFKKTVEK